MQVRQFSGHATHSLVISTYLDAHEAQKPIEEQVRQFGGRVHWVHWPLLGYEPREHERQSRWEGPEQVKQVEWHF